MTQQALREQVAALVDMSQRESSSLSAIAIYAQPEHPANLFGQLYHASAKLWLHGRMATIMQVMADNLYDIHGWSVELRDGLRTVDAQIHMDINYLNPNKEGMLSKPASGAHPKGLAIDLLVRDTDGAPIDMGTGFDALVPESARTYGGLAAPLLENRKILELASQKAALTNHQLLAPLRNEWWDFRVPEDAGDLWRVCESWGRVSGYELEFSDAKRLAYSLPVNSGSKAVLDKVSHYLVAHPKVVGKLPEVENITGWLSESIWHGDLAPLTEANITQHCGQVSAVAYPQQAADIVASRLEETSH